MLFMIQIIRGEVYVSPLLGEKEEKLLLQETFYYRDTRRCTVIGDFLKLKLEYFVRSLNFTFIRLGAHKEKLVTVFWK